MKLLKSEHRKFKAATYTVIDKSFLCPENSTKAGDLVIGFEPLEKVDPRNLFAFVVDKDGETQSVSRKFLKKETVIELGYERVQFDTAFQEKKKMLAGMKNYFSEKAK